MFCMHETRLSRRAMTRVEGRLVVVAITYGKPVAREEQAVVEINSRVSCHVKQLDVEPVKNIEL